MKKMYIAWIIMIILIIGTFGYVAFSFTKSVEDYQILEHDLEEAATTYLLSKEIVLIQDTEYKITLDDLKEEDILPNMEVGEDKCDGYVIAKRGIGETEYNAIIECENYKTSK